MRYARDYEASATAGYVPRQHREDHIERTRWHPVSPLGVPHKAIAEDEYQGMRIPKGSTVIFSTMFVANSLH